MCHTGGLGQGFLHGLQRFSEVFILADIVFFKNGFFQFCVKQAKNGPAKTLAFQYKPALQFIGRNVVYIYGLLYPGIGIGAFGANGTHQFVVFVSGGKFGGFNLSDLFPNTALFLLRDPALCGESQIFAQSDPAMPFLFVPVQ